MKIYVRIFFTNEYLLIHLIINVIKVNFKINDLNINIYSTNLCKLDWLWPWLWPWLEFWLSNFFILFILTN